MSRAYTEDEVKMMIINHAKRMAKYWAELPDVDKATGQTKEGSLNSIFDKIKKQKDCRTK